MKKFYLFFIFINIAIYLIIISPTSFAKYTFNCHAIIFQIENLSDTILDISSIDEIPTENPTQPNITNEIPNIADETSLTNHLPENPELPVISNTTNTQTSALASPLEESPLEQK